MMRKLLLGFVSIMLIFIATGNLSAQTYALNNGFTSGQTITTCSGFFFDSQPAGNYGPNENYTVTFRSNTPGRQMRVDFTEMGILAGDSLEVFDGLTTAAPRIYVFNAANSQPLNLVSSNADRALTFRFRSDATIQGSGWRGVLKCAPPCQPITGGITLNGVGADANGNINFCPSPTTNFTIAANVTFPQSGPFPNYTQSVALSRFTWNMGGIANDTTTNGVNSFVRRFNVAAGFNIKVTVLDTNGCSQVFTAKLRGSVKPRFNVTGGNMCLGDTLSIPATFTAGVGGFIQAPIQRNRQIALVDNVGGSGTCGLAVRDTLTVNQFAPGTTISNLTQDFIGVTVNMEHSYMGDLSLQLIAPNGAIIDLKPFINDLATSGGGTNLGEPVLGDAGNNPIPGRGYSYRFRPAGTSATRSLIAAGLAPTPYTYVSTTGVTVNDVVAPAGDYLPRTEGPTPTPFTLLNGSPVNGNWILRYCDNWGADNGTLFFWNLEFGPSLQRIDAGSINETYSIGPSSATWLPGLGLIDQTQTGNVYTARVSPTVASVYNYRFRVTDSANCVYDTVVRVFANPRPLKSTFNADTIICSNTAATLQVQNVQANTTYNWFLTGNISGTPAGTGTTFTTPILPLQPASVKFYLNAVSNGCNTRDTVSVRILQLVDTPVVTLTNATRFTLTFSWPAVANATGYQISVDGGATFITPNGTNGLSHTVSGLRPYELKNVLVRALGPVACQNSLNARASGRTLVDELFVPNAFTPNADGKNDVWMPYGYLIQDIDLKIFNQWGELVFESRDKTKGWDGTSKGKQQPMGVYVYTLRVNTVDGKVIDKKGSINLVR
ncbi:MAG: gliding motility-associated C-terminal domain-containing protein [Chitinophagaceae bacterium]